MTGTVTLDALWMPFTANRAFKRAPRLLVSAHGMYYTASDGRRILDGTAGPQMESADLPEGFASQHE